MKSKNLFTFFLREIDIKTWLKVNVNLILQILLVLFEISFISTFFLLINGTVDIGLIGDYLVKIKNYLQSNISSLTQQEIYILLLVYFLIFKNLLTIFQIYFYSNMVFKLTTNKSANILKIYLNKSFEKFNKKTVSQYIKQIIRDAENVFIGIFGLLVTIVCEIIYLSVLIYFVSKLVDLNLNIEIILLTLSLIMILYLLMNLSKKLGNIRAISEIKVFKSLTETLNIFKEIKTKNNNYLFVNRFGDFLKNYFNSRVGAGVINVTPKFIFEIFIIIFFFIIFRNQNLSIDEFILNYSVLAIALLRMIPTFSKISQSWSMVLYQIKAINFIDYDLSNKINKSSSKQKKLLEKINQISLKGIEIRYQKSNTKFLSKKLKNINLNFVKGNIYGLFGESGSGKTSILNIIAGFISPYKGHLYVNEKKMRTNEITKKFKIGYATQNPTIIDENILFNTTLDIPLNEKEKNKLELKVKFYLNTFNLKKFDTNKFFKNTTMSSIKNMSGGEIQRIGFIRSIIDDPDVILLDEPTSSLDQKNEKKILNYLSKIKNDKIIIMTSHKNSHKKYFDKVIYL